MGGFLAMAIENTETLDLLLPDLDENVDVTIINDNFQKIDDKIGAAAEALPKDFTGGLTKNGQDVSTDDQTLHRTGNESKSGVLSFVDRPTFGGVGLATLNEVSAGGGGTSGLFTTFISPNEFIANSGSPSLSSVSFGDIKQSLWLLDPATTEALTSSLAFPSNVTRVKFTAVMTRPASSSSTNRYSLELRHRGNLIVGESLDQVGHVEYQRSKAVSGNQYTTYYTELARYVAITPGTPMFLRLLRNASDAADTYASDIGFLGLLVQEDPLPTNEPGNTVTDTLSSWWSVPNYAISGTNVLVTGTSSDGKGLINVLKPSPATSQRIEVQTTVPIEDDHCTPSISIGSDIAPYFFWNRHQVGSDQKIRAKTAAGTGITNISDLPNSATQVIDFPDTTAYQQVFRRPGTSEWVMFTRQGNYNWGLSTSSDNRVTWTTPKILLSGGGTNQIYMRMTQTSDGNLNMSWYGHPALSTIHDVYFARGNMATGDITRLDGTVIGNFKTGVSLAMAMTAGDLVYSPTGGENTRLFEVSHSITNPAFVIASWTTLTTTASDAMYRHIRWNGSTWVANNIVACGLDFAGGSYVGGITFRPGDETSSVVGLSREASGIWYIERRTTTNDGVSWTSVQKATADYTSVTNPKKAVRPQLLPAGAPYDIYYHELSRYGQAGSNVFADYFGTLKGVI